MSFQGSVLGLASVRVLINHLHNGSENMLATRVAAPSWKRLLALGRMGPESQVISGN